MPNRGWARCTDSVADVLRRGAWYPIVEETTDGHIVVQVRAKRVRLTLADVRVRDDAPTDWSVVVRTGVLRPTLGGKGNDVVTTYGVCAKCQERQEFDGKPLTLKCTRCGHSAAVDWSEIC